jgi:hypothetical protein
VSSGCGSSIWAHDSRTPGQQQTKAMLEPKQHRNLLLIDLSLAGCAVRSSLISWAGTSMNGESNGVQLNLKTFSTFKQLLQKEIDQQYNPRHC